MKFRTVLRIAAALLAFLSASTAHALFRAYLSVDGADTNNCTVQAPCRLLPAALAAVDSGGEVWILDSANYNTAPVTIGKSVSILAIPGAVGSFVTSGGPALTITAAGLTIALRNLVVVPLTGASGGNGIQMTGASDLTIEHTLVANVSGTGVNVNGTGKLKMSHSIIRNTGGLAVGLFGGATGDISHTQMLGNAFGGVQVGAALGVTTNATVSDSIIVGTRSSDLGVKAGALSTGSLGRLFLTRSTIENTFTAIECESSTAGVPAIVAISGNTIVNNQNGWSISGADAVVRTLGNNHITDNTVTAGALTPTALQ